MISNIWTLLLYYNAEIYPTLRPKSSHLFDSSNLIVIFLLLCLITVPENICGSFYAIAMN